ncbi:MAG: glycosyltransferase, partial [Lysobacterales bacterium]
MSRKPVRAMSPLVSVVMPVRNGGAWLAEAADSILAQSCRDLELLVVDDHSNDGAIGGLPRNDARLTVMQSAGRGVSDAFNTGLAHSRGR